MCYIYEIAHVQILLWNIFLRNPKKGYNLTTGGRTGGRLSKRTKEKVSKTVSKVWDTPGYKEMRGEIDKEAWKNKG